MAILNRVFQRESRKYGVLPVVFRGFMSSELADSPITGITGDVTCIPSANLGKRRIR